MSATIHLAEPLAGEQTIDCETACVIGDLVWATPADGDGETIVPLSNVSGIDGEDVEQAVEKLESPGGLFTELVTTIS
jgi:hypothetical protein